MHIPLTVVSEKKLLSSLASRVDYINMTKTRRKCKTKKSLVPTEVVEMRVPPKLSSLRIVLVGAVLGRSHVPPSFPLFTTL